MHTLEQLRSGALAGVRRLDLSANLHTLLSIPAQRDRRFRERDR